MLPGEELVAKGLADIEAGEETIESVLVQIGRPRLERLGFPVPRSSEPPERRLHELLTERYADGAHHRYNELVRRLVGFERSAECAATQP